MYQTITNKMSSQKNPDWRMLGHDLIFQEIMMMVGLDSLESLHRCRQVCTAWNTMIMQNIWERKGKRNIIKMRIQKIWASKKLPSDKDIAHAKWLGNNNSVVVIIENTLIIIILETKGILDTELIESLAKRVNERESVRELLLDEYGSGCGSLPSIITRAASLAHHGLLGSVWSISLCDDYPTSLPAEHLASLVSSATEWVSIENVSGCDLVNILDSVKSKDLSISRQSLSSEETKALVRAMESWVEEVELDEDVTLDIWDLMEYSGQGKCRKVWCDSDTADRYKEQLRTWATSRNWEVTRDVYGHFIIEKNLQVILKSIKSEWLGIRDQSLDSEENKTMESGVEAVELYLEVTLDILPKWLETKGSLILERLRVW